MEHLTSSRSSRARYPAGSVDFVGAGGGPSSFSGAKDYHHITAASGAQRRHIDGLTGLIKGEVKVLLRQFVPRIHCSNVWCIVFE